MRVPADDNVEGGVQVQVHVNVKADVERAVARRVSGYLPQTIH
jgi:hypothetical protein